MVLDGGSAVASLVAAGAQVAARATWERGGLALRELLGCVARGEPAMASPASSRVPAGPG